MLVKRYERTDGNRRKKRAHRVPPLYCHSRKGHRNRHGSIGHLWLPVSDPQWRWLGLSRPVSFINGDFSQKRKFSILAVFNAHAECKRHLVSKTQNDGITRLWNFYISDTLPRLPNQRCQISVAERISKEIIHRDHKEEANVFTRAT